jgi:hypothetical protein
VDYRVAVVAGSIDERMWSMITSKQGVLDGADVADNRDDETAAAAQVAWELVESGLHALAAQPAGHG